MKRILAMLFLLPISIFAQNVREIKPNNILPKSQLLKIEILEIENNFNKLNKNKEAENIKSNFVFVDVFKTRAKIVFA